MDTELKLRQKATKPFNLTLKRLERKGGGGVGQTDPPSTFLWFFQKRIL